MFYRLLLICFFAGITGGGMAQVKLLTLGGNLGNFSNHNLGKNLGASEKSLPESRTDSMILISDDYAVVVSEGYCNNGYKKTARIWKVRKDTALNHPVFAGEHCIDSVKNFLDNPVVKKLLDSMKVYSSGKIVANPDKAMVVVPVKARVNGSNSNLSIAFTTVILVIIAYVALIADRYYRMNKQAGIKTIRPPVETLS